jgi:Flp pilus assembly protein CpaB
MNYRVRNIGIAVALAALAAILTSVYVVNYKRHVQNGEHKVAVFVAARDIPAGTTGADVVEQHMLKKVTIPKKAVVAGAISSPSDLSVYIATQDVFEGEQVTTRRFAPPKEQGIRSQIKGTQRAYQLAGDRNQVLVGTLKAGDHVDVVGAWTIKGGNDQELNVSRVAIRDLLVLNAGEVDGGTSATDPGTNEVSVQLRVTDAQSQKLQWIATNGEWHLELRPPSNSLDSANTYQDSHLMLFDGPGRRPH